MTHAQFSVLAFGEILWDILPAGAALGGAPFNFAYRISTLGDCGSIVSRVGDDDLGRQALLGVTSLGMSDAHIQRDPVHVTGTVHIDIEPDGRLNIDIVPNVAYDYIEPAAALLPAAQAADCICFGTVAQRSPVSRQTLYNLLDAAPRAVKLFDINLRKNCYTVPVIEESLRRAGILKLNLDEANELAAMFQLPLESLTALTHAAIDRWDLSHCLVTLGDQGVFAATSLGETVNVPSPTVEVVDTLGSGDAFTAGFLHRSLRNYDLESSCRFGNALGAMVAAQHGATGPTDRYVLEANTR